jgi:hypothetical protein
MNYLKPTNSMLEHLTKLADSNAWNSILPNDGKLILLAPPTQGSNIHDDSYDHRCLANHDILRVISGSVRARHEINSCAFISTRHLCIANERIIVSVSIFRANPVPALQGLMVPLTDPANV